MRPTHLSRLLVRGLDLDDLALLHCEWALGLDRFAALRETRLAAGVPRDARPVDLLGTHGDRWVFRFSLPIERGKRTSAVRISAMHGGVLVEHLVVHEGPNLPADSSADSPETTRALIELPGVEPAMLRQFGPAVLGERDVPALVAEALAPGRPAPIVLVSVDNGTREPLVDPHELARRLAGMVKVVWLSTVSASRRLKDELMSRGFSEKFGCFHGGVRILWPGIEKDDNPYDHLLLLPMRIERLPARARTERVAGLFCEMIAEDEDLRAWLREVDAPTRPVPLRRQAPEPTQSPTAMARSSGRVVLSEPPPAPTSPPTPPAWRSPLARPTPAPAPLSPAHSETLPGAAITSPPPANEASAGMSVSQAPDRPPAMRAEPPPPTEPPQSPAPPPASTSTAPPTSPTTATSTPVSEELEPPAESRLRPRGETPWSRLASDVVAAAELAEELEDELEELRHELAASRKAQRRAEQERDEAVEARFAAKTALEAVALAEACFPDRLIVLPSARSSAEASPFRDPSLIFQVLALLAFFGRHDGTLEAALEKALGAQARWRPKDSPDTTARFGAHRTWADSSGARKLFRRHITLGHGVDAQRCAQVYYDVTTDGRIELAWVGEHRPTVSEDT